MREIIDSVECDKCPVRKRCEEVIDVRSRCPLAVKIDNVMILNLIAEGRITWEEVSRFIKQCKEAKNLERKT